VKKAQRHFLASHVDYAPLIEELPSKHLAATIYEGTFERTDDFVVAPYPNTTSSYRDHVLQWSKNLGRTVSQRQRGSDSPTSIGGQMRTYALAVDATSRDCLTGAREMKATPMAMNTADPISSL
jgi:hypothetical protein